MRPKFYNSLIFVVSLLLCWIVPSKSWASVVVDGIYYELNDQARTAEVTRKPTNSYSGDVVIPESFIYDGNTYTVMSIGEMAFYPREYQGEVSRLTSVTIPNSVKKIEDLAFLRCHLLTSVTIPNADIYGEAFVGCSGLTSLTIGSGVSYISEESFGGCSSLTSITIDVSNPFYDSRDNCNAIIETSTNKLISGCKNTVIPNCVTEIGGSAFSGCTSLTSVEIPNSVTEIGSYAFYGCTSLTSVEIPNSVTEIGGYAFSQTAWYENQPDGLIYINQVAYKYKGEMPMGIEIAIKSGTVSISGNAFDGCTGLTSIEIPNSVTEIGSSAFSACTGLTSVEIPNSVTNIGYGAFSGCTGLTSVEIPNSVTEIGGYAFSQTAWYENQPDGLIYINQVAYKYKGEMPMGTEIAIKSGTVSISGSAFSGCTGLISVEIPNSVTEIGSSAFSGCTGLISVEIPNSVTEIGSSAFSGCTGLTSVEIPSSVSYIGVWAFSSCSGLNSITVERESPAYVGVHAFRDIDKTNCTLYVPVGSKSAYESAVGWKDFWNIVEPSVVATGSCGSNVTYTIYSDMTMVISGTGDIYVDAKMRTNGYQNYYQTIQKLIIEDGVTSIGISAFPGCTSLTSVLIGNSVTSIYDRAFSGCTSLTSITIPSSVTYISSSYDDSSFQSCSNLTSIIVDANNQNYDSRDNCNAIIETSSNLLIQGCMNTVIPENVTSIGEFAFYGCTGLTSITIPNSVTAIGDGAFTGCTGLTSITVERESPATVCEGEFSDVDKSNCTLYVPFGSKTAYENFEGWSEFENIVESPALIDNLYYRHNISDNTAIVEGISDLIYSGSITIPESIEYAGNTYAVTEIGLEAFLNCTGLTSVVIPNSVTRIVEGAFYGCAGLTSLEIPNGVTYIDDYTFDSCTGLTSVTIPNSVTNIGMCAFGRCTGLTSVDIPNSVTHIGDGAFVRCIGLTSIVIPNSVIEIGVEAFENCTGLTSVTVEWTNPLAIESSIFENVDKSACTLYVPVGTKEAYENAEGWNEFENIVEIGEELDTDISTLDNAIYVEQTEARIGGTMDIPVKLKNSYAVRGFQFRLELPEGATINSWALSSGRMPSGAAESDEIATQKIDGNTIAIACSLNYGAATFTGNDGEIATVSVTFAEDMEEGRYPICLTGCDVTTADGVDEDLSDIKATLVLEDYLPGDANGDGKVRIGDATAILNYIVGNVSSNFQMKAADTNGDGKIRIGDATAVLNLIVNQL